MFVHDVVGSEANPVYQNLAIENLDRQLAFLKSAVIASIGLGRPLHSLEAIRAFNYHAIACLHAYAGEFRPCHVEVGQGDGKYIPPEHYQVPALMEMFVDEVNRSWDRADPVALAAYVLWKLNRIHPFINGNGRAARAACYFVLCLKMGGWLKGTPILPYLLKRDRDDYVAALKEVDASLAASNFDLAPLHSLIVKLLKEQAPDGIGVVDAPGGNPSAGVA
jgi:Fic family protein